MKLRLKKGEKLTFIGFEKDSQNNLSKLIFETSGLNKLEIYADGEKYQYHNIGVRIIDERKPSEDLEIP
jgi:ABC-type sugar transport system ATPase subunit